MADDLLSGRVTSFQREQGFGVITLDDGRPVKFDSSICTMVPEEGAAVRLRIGPAKWGGGFKALHVEPSGSSVVASAEPLTLDQQVAVLQAEHLVSALSERVMGQLEADLDDHASASLLDVIDAFYRRDPTSARHDGYFPVAAVRPAVLLRHVTTAVPGLALPANPDVHTVDDVVHVANRALEAAGDLRRMYRLVDAGHARACLLIEPYRAARLALILPFA